MSLLSRLGHLRTSPAQPRAQSSQDSNLGQGLTSPPNLEEAGLNVTYFI